MATFKLKDRARAKLRMGSGRVLHPTVRPVAGARLRAIAKRQAGSLGFSAGTTRRPGTRTRGVGVGGCGVGRRIPAGNIRYGQPMPHAVVRSSPGFSGGSGKRVPPPPRPNGRFGGRGAIGWRYPGSNRIVQVGASLVEIGEAMCVPCSKKARAARG